MDKCWVWTTCRHLMDISTVKGVLALASTWGVPAKHGNIPNAYVKAEKVAHLRIFMHVPKGMTVDQETVKKVGVDDAKDVVLELYESLYGLKQAGRLLNKLLHGNMIKMGFNQCISDICLYYKPEDGILVTVSVYVDDLLVTATDQAGVEKFFVDMKVFEVKNLGQVSKFLGMRIHYDDENSYIPDQEEAIDEFIRSHDLGRANSSRTPIGPECYKEFSDGAEVLTTMSSPTIKDFQSLVGSLLWVARCMRPNIAFAVHKATRQTHKARSADWRMAK